MIPLPEGDKSDVLEYPQIQPILKKHVQQFCDSHMWWESILLTTVTFSSLEWNPEDYSEALLGNAVLTVSLVGQE